jgi:hypothetical protein
MSSHDSENGRPKKCPSAQVGMAELTILGIASYSNGNAEIAYIEEPISFSDGLATLAESVPKSRVFRLAGACEERRCLHFDGNECRLAQRIVHSLPVVVDILPPCTIRKDCRWYSQEGAAACMRCPQIVTLTDVDDPVMIEVALGTTTDSDATGALFR